MDLLDRLAMDDLNEEQRELAELIGIDNYKKLVRSLGGCNVYVYKESTLVKKIRDKEILKMFNGGNFKEIAKYFDLSEQSVRSILNDINGIDANQMCITDYLKVS